MELWKGQPIHWHGVFACGSEGLEKRLSVTPFTPREGGFGLTVHLGGGEMPDGKLLCRAAAKVVATARELGAESLVLDVAAPLEAWGTKALAPLAEGAALAGFRRESWKTGEGDKAVAVYIRGGEGHEAVLAEVGVLCESVLLARQLVNAPANRLTPVQMAKTMIKTARAHGIETEILDESAMEAQGMEALLTVGRSAFNPPRLIVLRYSGDPGGRRVGLVGKGVTCDTGGYNLKPSAALKGIRGDMAGGAAVFGCVLALARNKIPVNAVAVIPAVENRISPDSYLPGDVIGSMAGKTIEIGNTDAEGRLLLADAMTYAIRREKVDEVVDIATLTGAVVNMFGFTTAGLMTNHEAIYQRFSRAAAQSGEQYWRLPDYQEYSEMIKSPVADLRNVSADGCGTITAGLFLREFCQGKPWIHLDIAGTAWVDAPKWEHQSKGATGAGVTTLYHFCKEGAEPHGDT